MSETRFKFERLIIWQKAMDFGEELNALSVQFPAKEKFNLSSQIIRAVDSIALNISEGSICQSNPEFRKFLGYSIRSLAEVITCLHKARRREYLSKSEFDKQYDEAFHLMNMMISFRNKVLPSSNIKHRA
ncbi:MAG: four helix bundle protein [Parvicellaceae bacterium]|jgi:four helix bundle protein